jgi:nickel transport protein
MMRRKVLLLLVVLFLMGYSQASAHRVQVFAAVEEGVIKGEATVSGQHPVIEGDIKVFSRNDQKLLLTLTTDATGSFIIDPMTLGLERPVDLLIVLDADPGHRAEWQVSGTAYALSADQSLPQVSKAADAKVPNTPMPSPPTLGSVVSGIVVILGLGALINWSRSRRRNQR